MTFLFTTRLMLCAALASVLAALAVGAGFAWHEIESGRAAQRPFLLSQAFAGAQELRLALEEHHLDSLPPQLPAELEARLKQQFADLGGDGVLGSLGIVTEVLRLTGVEPTGKNRYLRAGFFATASSVPTELAPASNLGPSPSLTLVCAGAPSAVSPRFLGDGKDGLVLDRWIGAAIPVTLSNGRPIGVIHVLQPLYQLRHLFSAPRLSSILAVGALGGILPGLLIFLSFGNRHARRLRRLVDGFLALRQGQWDHRIEMRGFDELSQAGRIFDQTIEHLQKDERNKQQIIQETLTARKLAEAGMETKANFLASMSHEIRTPMNGIIGTTSLLLDTRLTSEQLEFVRMIRSSGESLLHLINDILDFSKLESSKMSLEQLPVCLEDLFQETMSIFAFKAAEKEIELNYHVGEALPSHVTGDFHRLKQILVNLVGNAVKFTEKGEILLLAQHVIRTSPDGPDTPFLHLSVRDTGIGIPPHKIPELFTAFTQADTSTTRKYGGTGLGLAISRKLCQLMGGEISVTSEPGVGSNFYLEIPLRAAPGDHRQLAQEQIRLAVLRQLQVRVVSSRPTTAGIVQHYCNLWGMAVDCQTLHPDAAPETLVEGRHHILVLDSSPQELPAAIRVAGAARSQEKAVVCLAPLGQEQIKQAIMSCAGSRAAFVPKPVNRRDLMIAFVRALESAARAPAPDAGTGSGTEPAPAGPATPARTFAHQVPARILLVEDQPMNQKLGLIMLRKLGYTDVELAENGREAVDKVCSRNYDAVFMDLHMPVMDGIEAAREIRGNFTLAHQPVIIALTGHALAGVKENCRDIGMNDFLTKPVSIEDIKEALARTLGAGAAARA